MKKDVHWDIESKRLHRKEIIFCFVESIKNHWILEKSSSIDERFEAFEVKSKTFKSDLMTTSKECHEMLSHSRSKIITHLAVDWSKSRIE